MSVSFRQPIYNVLWSETHGFANFVLLASCFFPVTFTHKTVKQLHMFFDLYGNNSAKAYKNNNRQQPTYKPSCIFFFYCGTVKLRQLKEFTKMKTQDLSKRECSRLNANCHQTFINIITPLHVLTNFCKQDLPTGYKYIGISELHCV